MIRNGLQLISSRLSSVKTTLGCGNLLSVTQSKVSWKGKCVRPIASRTNLLRQLPANNTNDSGIKLPGTPVIKEQCTIPPPVAINGFGRIGKCVLRLAIQKNVNVVAVNEPSANAEAIAHSFKYDTDLYANSYSSKQFA